jgi:hypothetical protein
VSPLEEAQRTLYRIGSQEVDDVLRLTKQAADEVARVDRIKVDASQHRTACNGMRLHGTKE